MLSFQKNFETNQAKRVREYGREKKDGLALSSHFSGSGKLRASFLISVKKWWNCPPPQFFFNYISPNDFRWTVVSVEVVYYEIIEFKDNFKMIFALIGRMRPSIKYSIPSKYFSENLCPYLIKCRYKNCSKFSNLGSSKKCWKGA